MANLIKNRIIKHLSKFARNITADQISVQILSGHGELRNIELNETVLTEVLEFPVWLRINSAKCNRIAVKIPWTRLKSSPIQFFIDEFVVELELLSDSSPKTAANFFGNLNEASSYGFVNRVVEGMSIYINTLEVNFNCGSFGGSLMLSRLSVESCSPGWQAINDLTHSRIADASSNQSLMYKQVTWQLLRIEISIRNEATSCSKIIAPLRLITSGGKSRITVKKSTLDGNVIGGRIQVILDDILSIATLPQVRSAIAFYSHIVSAIKSAPKQIGIPSVQGTEAKLASQNLQSKQFVNFNFDQTSFHFYIGKIDLHLCDDNAAISDYPKDWNIECGALQVTLLKISIDFYPTNVATSDRSKWVRYNSENQCSDWFQEILQSHYHSLCSLLDTSTRNRFMRIWPQLLSQNYVIRVHDLIVQCVTDSQTKKDTIFNVFMSDRNSKASLPFAQQLIHLEFASFYHPATENMPLPPNITHLLLGPFLFVFDQRTIRWLLYVFNDLNKVLQSLDVLSTVPNLPRTDVRIDGLMPKFIIPVDHSPLSNDFRLPQRIVISVSAVHIVNNALFHSDDSKPFFNSLSSNFIDFVDSSKLFSTSSSFRNFLIGLNQYLTPGKIDGEERFWIKTSPIWVDTDYGEFTSPVPLVGDVAVHGVIELTENEIHIALQPQCRVKIAVDHFQFVLISYLFKTISSFIDKLDDDIKFFSSNNRASIPVYMTTIMESVEINLVLSEGLVATPYSSPDALRNFNSSLVPEVIKSAGGASEVRNNIIAHDTTSMQSTAISQSAVTNNSNSNDQQKSSQSLFVVNEAIGSCDSDLNIFSNFSHFEESTIATDETLSISTNLSDDDSQNFYTGCEHATTDDIFESVAYGEDAFIADETLNCKDKFKFALSKTVNVLTASLNDFNLLLSLDKSQLILDGYSNSVALDEILSVTYNTVLSSINKKSDMITAITCNAAVNDENILRIKLLTTNAPGTNLLINICGLRARISMEILKHLSHYIDIDDISDASSTDDANLYIKIQINDSNISIIESSSKNSLRMSINDFVIEQGNKDQVDEAVENCVMINKIFCDI